MCCADISHIPGEGQEYVCSCEGKRFPVPTMTQWRRDIFKRYPKLADLPSESDWPPGWPKEWNNEGCKECGTKLKYQFSSKANG